MNLRPVKATAWKGLPEDLKEMMLVQGAVPVNEVFFDHWDKYYPIFLLYGSYGSGKSIFAVDRKIRQVLRDPYRRVYFGRKVLDTVRGTIFQTIVDRIKELKREDDFIFSEAPNGSMHIRCKHNGNSFIPFGANDPQSLKSIKDPTDFLLEEMDQFSFEDFGLFYSRLRTEKVADKELVGMFNTDKLYQSHWIRKILFDGEFADQAIRVKANFYDNVFVNVDEYERKLRLISGGNAAKFNAIAHGEMALIRTGEEFWKQFDETKHIGPAPVTKTTIHISLDENVNPYVTVSCWQVDTEAKQLRQVHEIPCKSPDNNAPKAAKKLADWLRSIGYGDVVFLYGDPSASKRSTIDPNNRSFYDKFIETLEAEGFKVTSRVQRSAPEVALSAAFINAIYEQNLGGWSILISERCFTSIEDYLLVKEDADGRMFKEKVKDKETGITAEPRGHFSDAKRYFITTILAAEFAKYKTRGRKRGIQDVTE